MKRIIVVLVSLLWVVLLLSGCTKVGTPSNNSNTFIGEAKVIEIGFVGSGLQGRDRSYVILEDTSSNERYFAYLEIDNYVFLCDKVGEVVNVDMLYTEATSWYVQEVTLK